MDTDQLYGVLRKNPGYEVALTWDRVERLHIRVSTTRGSQVPGLDTCNISTVFNAQKRISINVVVPKCRIEQARIDLILAEIEWAIEEIARIKKGL